MDEDRISFREYTEIIESLGFLYNFDYGVHVVAEKGEDKKPMVTPMQHAWLNLVNCQRHELPDDQMIEKTKLFELTIMIESLYNFLSYLIGAEEFLVKTKEQESTKSNK